MGSVGGDDVGAVVVDLGAWLTRVGFAGDDTPRSVFPSAVGYRRDVGGGNGVKTEAVLERGHDAGGAEDAMEDGRDSGEKVGPSSAREGRREAQLRGTAYAGDLLMANPSIYDDVESVYEFLDDGSCKLNHWDAFEDVLRHGVQSQLRSDPGCQPLLVVEPAFRWDPETRTKAAERIFEGLGSSSCFLARGAVMTTFASARSTALVIDVGAQGTACVPVVEGYVLEKASQFSHVGGHLLTSKFRELILAKLKGSPDLLATHEVRRRRENGVLQVDPLPKPEVRTVSHQGFHRMRLFDEMKASMCYLPVLADSEAEKNPPTSTDPSEGSLTPATRKTTAVNHGPAVYELPDGRNLEISPDEATSVPELLFNPPAGGSAKLGAAQLIFEAASACDVDSRRELYNSLILTGGSSLFPGVTERFQRDIAILTPQMFKTKVIASSNNYERMASPWIGGSILGSLGTFNQMWMSKKEYDEFGANFILRRCP